MSILSAKAHTVLNDPARIAQRDLWFSRLQALFDGRPDPYNEQYVFTLGGSVPRPPEEGLAYTDPEAWVCACLELLAEQPPCADNRFAPECVEYPIYGVHFIDRMFGANVYFYEEQWNVDYLQTPVGQLQMPDLETDETWSLAKRAAQAFLDADVALPLFGMPTLASALNIFLNLYGQEALLAMLDDEEAALHDLTVINDLIRTLHRWYIEHIPSRQLQPVISWSRTQPPGFGQLCGCTTQLLSDELYREMIAPLDDALLSEYQNGGMIHLCGAHTQHISTFRDMPHLRALQIEPATVKDLDLYLAGLRKDQVVYVPDCAELPVEKLVSHPENNRIVYCSWYPAKPRA